MYFSRPATGKAPPVIASLDHLPTAWGGLFAAAGRQKGSSQCGELAEPARPEGLCRALPRQPVGAGHARPATWRTLQFSGLSPFLYCFVGKCPAPLHGGQRAGRPTNSRLRQGLYPSRGVATICGASGTPPPRLLSSLFATIYSPQQFLRCYPVQLRQRQQVCRAGVCAAVLPFGDRLTADA